ncbi:tetratricopeptide repeat protein [Marinobacter zhejiangensis]|uniref:TPR repeat-containing protein n=1 Tax=Marinobacter zhejiangensis TaxID=488535 RepID=A0A1I4QRN4_9GAMM|nr:tetratricopeptide repeat protein [Marinobacter zhejiangensis]SFM42385.1 TPR repeat-containing protein [Marinobacter zhejiangensis]
MYPQHQSPEAPSSQAELARRLLDANDAYQASNSPSASHPQRMSARAECTRLVESVLTEDPRHPAALGLMGRVAMDNGDMELAQTLFNRSLDENDQQPQQYTNLGYWALTTERPVLAEQYFLEALELDRQSAAAFCGIAHAKRIQGKFDIAYLHYRKLLNSGRDWPSIYSGMLACAENLAIHSVDQELALDAIALLRRDDLPLQQVGRFVAAIIRHQYDLDNPQAQVFLDAASGDELLILALEKTLMADPAVEEFVTLLRRAIVAEVAHSAELRDDLHPLTLAIARYADRTGYALLASDDEERLISAINESLRAQLAMGDAIPAIMGSVMLSAMYGALFQQGFAVHLGQWNLVDWPLASQTMMAASFYDKASEEAIKQHYDEKLAELCLDKKDLPQAWPCWSTLAHRTESSLKSILNADLGLATELLPDTLRILVCGAESGQRALELARYLSDVEVIAVDESLANIAKATRHAQELNIANIVFWPWSIAQRFVADGHQVHWIEIGRLPSPSMTDVSLAAMVNSASGHGCVVHMHTEVTEQTIGDDHVRKLIREHSLKPTRETLHRLRRMALNNRDDSKWQSVLAETGFYALGGCQDRWFRPQDIGQLKELMGLMSNELNWKLVKVRDSDGHSLATSPVQRQLQAEAQGDQVQTLMGLPLSLYFVKRA